MHTLPKRLIALLGAVIVVAPLLAGGCNTMAGAGKDISRAGDRIEDAAERDRRR